MFDDKKKILFFSQNLAPFRLKWANELAKYFYVTFVHLNEYSANTNLKYFENKYESNLNVVCCEKKILQKGVFDYKIIRNDFDLVVLDGYGYFGGILLIFYLFVHHIKFIMSIDGGFIPNYLNNYKSNGYIKKRDGIFTKFLKKIIFNSTNVFLSTSSNTDDYIKHYNKMARIYRHYFSNINVRDILSENDVLTYKRKCKDDLGFKNNFYVLFVGKFIEGKNLSLVFEISKHLPNDIKYVLIGGSLNGDLAKQYELCNKDNFIIIDFLNKKDLKKFFYASDIFIMPTFHDVWGLVVTEAFAFGGLPVISSDMCLAAKDLVNNGDNGYVINHDGPGVYTDQELVNKYIGKILYLCNNRDRIFSIMKNNLLKISEYAVENSTKIDFQNMTQIIYEFKK